MNNQIMRNLPTEEKLLEQQKGWHLFYLFPILYVISIYLIPFFLFAESGSVFSYMIVLPVLLGILNIIVAIVFSKPENRIMMLNAAVLIKYSLIPFFVLGGVFIACSLLLSFIPVPFMVFLGLPMALISSVIGWLALAMEAPYMIAYLRLSVKASVCSKGMAVVHTILQFFFTLDVIDTFILLFKEKKWIKLTIIVMVLLVMMIILLGVLIALLIIGAVFG